MHNRSWTNAPPFWRSLALNTLPCSRCARYYCYVKQQMEGSFREGAADASLPMSPPRLISVVRDIMPEDGITCLDNGLYKARDPEP